MKMQSATLSLSKWGNSIAVRLPRNIVDSLGWREGDSLECIQKDGAISIKKMHKVEIKPLNEIIDSFHTAQEISDIDWGKPVGQELW